MSTSRQRLSDIVQATPVLGWVGFAVTMAFLGFAGLMVAGYTLADPGGWTGLGLTALWVVPALALAVLAFYRPDTAVSVLAAAALAPVGFGVWTLIDYQGVRDWEDQRGPVLLVLIVAVGVPLAVEGLSRATAAGLMMLEITVVPLVLSIIGAGGQWGQALSIGLLSAPVVIGGVLFVLAGRSSARPRAHSGRPRLLTGH
jgi:hypothetical protein